MNTTFKKSLNDLIDEHLALVNRQSDIIHLSTKRADPNAPGAQLTITIDGESFSFHDKHYRSMRSVVLSAMRGYFGDQEKKLADEIASYG